MTSQQENSRDPKTGRFLKGHSGNPGGRVRTKPITEALEAILANPEYAQAIADALISRARRGDVTCAREVMDRVEGKVLTRVEQDIEFTVVPDPLDLMRKYADKAAKGSPGGNGNRKPVNTPRAN